MDCREARKAVAAVIEGTYDPGKLDDFIWHMEHCPDCHEELASSVYLQKSLDAYDKNLNLDFLNFDEDKHAEELLQNSKEKVIRYERIVKIRTVLDTITFWALALTLAMQILTWWILD